MKFRSLFIALFVFSLSFAQNYNPEMLVVKSDLSNNVYKKDSTANALVIYDYGNSFIDKHSYWLRVQIKQKVKILKPEGTDKGTVEVKLYKGKSSKEKIIEIVGATYNLVNNEIIKTDLLQSAIFKEENENYTLVKFVLPNVKVGSVITYSYETQSQFISKYQPWYFQGPNPVLYSEYNTSIPGNYEYNVKLVGSIPLDTKENHLEENCITIDNIASTGCSISKYVMTNIPAYKDEGYTTTALNYTSRIEYELSIVRGFDGSVNKLTKTWGDVDNELKTDSDFGKQISKKSLSKNILPESITLISDDLEKANAIYQFVLKNYKWNKESGRYQVSIKNLIKEKIGSAFEINLFLENLLSSQSIEVFPILMSTRANGLATKIFPVLTDFNYVILIAKIGGKDYYLDATDPYLSFGELPYRCLNQYGRLINFEYGSYWQDIKLAKFSFRQHRIKLGITKSNSLSGYIDSKYTGYHSHNLKRAFNENSSIYKTKKGDQLSNINITNHKINDFDKTNYEFSETINFDLEPEFIGNKIYFNPFIIKFFEENPFKLQERTYPIDFGYKDIYTYVMQIDLNNDIKIIELPSPLNLALPDGSGTFTFNISATDNKLIVYFKVNFAKEIYEAKLYETLKAFMNKIVETQKNTVIVLEKQ